MRIDATTVRRRKMNADALRRIYACLSHRVRSLSCGRTRPRLSPEPRNRLAGYGVSQFCETLSIVIILMLSA